MRLEETLSSKHAQDGDRFTVTLTEDVKLADGTVLKAGYRGVGEVIDARKNGMLGKTGKLNVRLTYLKVGEDRIRLRAAKNAQGDHRTGTQVVTFVFVGVFAGFIKGKNVSIPKGAQIMAYADEDKELETPLAAPPNDV
jgi:DNA topoisomerase IB